MVLGVYFPMVKVLRRTIVALCSCGNLPPTRDTPHHCAGSRPVSSMATKTVCRKTLGSLTSYVKNQSARAINMLANSCQKSRLRSSRVRALHAPRSRRRRTDIKRAPAARWFGTVAPNASACTGRCTRASARTSPTRPRPRRAACLRACFKSAKKQ